MIVELKPHVSGYKSTPEGLVPIEFDQWILMVDGRQWGYVSKRDLGHMPLIRQVTPEEEAEVRRLVEEQVGKRGVITSPPEIEEDTELDEEDDDEFA